MFSAVHEQLSAVTEAGKSRAELTSLIGALSRVELRATERRLAMIAAIDALDDGGIGGADAARAATKRSKRSSKKAAKTAEQLKDMPKMRKALADGDITEEHADAAADAAEATSPELADELAEDAKAQPADLFGPRARKWKSRREQDRVQQDRQNRQRKAREVKAWVNGDGMACFYLQFDPVDGEPVRKALAHETDRLWRADGGRDGTPDDVRTPEQRRADAMFNLITRPAAKSSKRPPPKYSTMLNIDVGRCTTDDPCGVAEFVDGTPIPQATLERIACDCEFAGIIYGADGAIMWQGRRKRIATDDQWAGLVSRDGGCVHCGADPSQCQAHHIVPWEAGGETNIDEMALLCHNDHHLVHEHGYTMVNIDGKWRLIPPKDPPDQRQKPTHRRTTPRRPTSQKGEAA